MAKMVRISIRTKILFVLSVLITAAVSVFLILASKIFYEDKTLLVYELNQNNVRTLGSELETRIRRVVDQLHVVSSLDPSRASALLKQEEGDIVFIGRMHSSRPEKVEMLAEWPGYFRTYSVERSYSERVLSRFKIPVENVVKKGIWVRNVTLPENGAPPLMMVAVPESGRPTGTVFFALVRLDHLLELFSQSGIAKVYGVDSEGAALVHSVQSLVLNGVILTDDPLVSAAAASKVRSEVKTFSQEGRSYLGSFYRLGSGNVVVVSKTPTDEAFSAVRLLFNKSLLYGLIVITASLLVALFLSHSLTAPIQRLVAATKRLASGDFEVAVPISTGDELASLGRSFNQMTQDLRVSRKKIEEYSQDLEKKVAERTQQLEVQNVAIKEAQEALIKTTRLASVGEIAGRAAHEVLNPLTNITTRIEIIRNQRLGANRQDLSLFHEIIGSWAKDYETGKVEQLVKGFSAPSQTQQGKTLLEEDLANLKAIGDDLTKRLDGLNQDVDFLLSESGRISKIVNGMRQLTRVSGARKKIAAADLVQDSLATMRDLFSRHQIQLETKSAEKAAVLFVDRDEMIQVFSNLLRNALQAIDEARKQARPVGNPPKVWISTEVTPEKRVKIRVSDNGPGISAEHRDRLFESGFSTKTATEGTGLGLSICRRFIRAYEGDITLEKSDPGVETAFVIDLPQESENDGHSQ